MQTKNNENQTTEDQDFQIKMNDQVVHEVTVIDIPEETREAEKKEEKKKYVNIFKQFTKKRVYTTAIIAYLSMVVFNIVYGIISSIVFSDKKEESTNQEILEDRLKEYTASMIMYSCIIAPIIEEFIFRSFIFKTINWIGKKIQNSVKFIGILIRILAFLISSFLFGFAHFAFDFKLLIAEINTFPTYFMAGIVLAWAYNRDGYYLASTLTHVINNSVSMGLLLLLNQIS